MKTHMLGRLIAWELLAGETTTLAELAELAFDDFTPSTAWTTWKLVADGLYFYGSPEEILARSPAAVAQVQSQREAKAAEERYQTMSEVIIALAAWENKESRGCHYRED